jgi:integrase/recombinase XerD
MAAYDKQFNQNYQTHLKHLRLKRLQPKTIEAYAIAMRHVGGYFNNDVNDLSEAQLVDYFSSLLTSHSWSSVG